MVDLIGQKLGEYQITSVLGEGGMAVVYRAKQQNIKREVAVKVIQPRLRQSADFSARFEREAQMIASMTHPNIIKVFDFGVLRGFHLRLLDPTADARKDMIYIVMEMLSGGTLSDLIKSGPLPLSQIGQFMGGIASALDYAHQKKVIHCDLKPENVLLDETQNVYLADFGIAQLISSTAAPDQEDDDIVAGTPYYMAPEQWTGSTPPGPATDVYALGIMLFEMLTGHVPYDADTPFKLMDLHLKAPVPSVLTARPEITPSVQGILERALAKNPEDRYPTAGQFASDFRMAFGGRTRTVTITPDMLPKLAAPATSSVPAPRAHTSIETSAVPVTSPLPAPTSAKSAAVQAQTLLATRRVILIGAAFIVLLLVLLAALAFAPRQTAGGAISGAVSSDLSNADLVQSLAAATLTQRAIQATNAAVITKKSIPDVNQTIAARVSQMEAIAQAGSK